MAQAAETTPSGSGAFRAGSTRGADGFFRVAQTMTGQWWLLDPEGRPCLVRAVHEVCADGGEAEPAKSADPAVRLRTWGFNAVGVGGDGSGRDDGLPYFAAVDFTASAPPILAPGVRLPDVFDPDWRDRAVMQAAARCAPRAADRELIGWVTDDELAWGWVTSSRPGLLQICLSLEPVFTAYHAAWEFALASHGGTLDSLARAWGVSLPNKEVVREMTRAENGVTTRGYIRDDAHWTREFAHRYFSGTAEAIRAIDRQHLLCGCRFRAPAGAAVLAAATYPSVDVALPHWSELPAPGAAVGPLIAGDVSWSDPGFWAAPSAISETVPVRRGSRLTAVERMLRRARTALKRLARHPAVVGFVWRQWHDDPGEHPPFAHGLVHPNGIEAREHTDLLAEFNPRAEGLRRAAAKLLSP